MIREIIDNTLSKCMVIAEIGNNHGGNIDICKDMIRTAAQCGATAVKLQKRDNKSLFTKTFYNSSYENENSFGRTYGEHRENLELKDADFLDAKEEATKHGVLFSATPFDIPSAQTLQAIDVPFFKIASADIKNLPLLRYIAQFKKPVIVSTGGATFEDINVVYDLLVGQVELALLHCIATYPNKAEEMNLEVIKTMKSRYPRAIIGFSSHHPSVFMPITAHLLGAEILEVHFTLNRAQKGTDHALSLEPKGLQTLCSDLASIKAALGNGIKCVLPVEEKAIRKMGKSIWPVRTIKTGEVITEADIALKIPAGEGLPPDRFENVIGRVAINDLSTASAIREKDIA